MNKKLKRLLGIVIIIGLAILFVWTFQEIREEREREREREQPVKIPPRVSRGADGEFLVTLDRKTQERIALKIQTLEDAKLQPEFIAYGRLEEDPSRTFTLRAPIAGILHRTKDRDWPRPGDSLQNSTLLGTIAPRFTPAERTDLMSRLSTARADVKSTTASLEAARATFDRAKTLNAEEKNISDRVLQEAEARMKSEEARLTAATEIVYMLEGVLDALEKQNGTTPLILDRVGEVVEVLAQPDEAVESGQAILKVTRFDRLIARVMLTAGENISGPVTTARIAPIGHENHPLRAESIAPGGAVDPKLPGQVFLAAVNTEGLSLRPGMAVTAYLARPGEPEKGTMIPRSAVVRFSGKAWVYLQIDEGKFSRREVELNRPAESGWFVTSGLKAADRIVIVGTQALLSEELKSQLQVEEEEKK